mgnify:CR=1 FL=1
MICAPLLAVGIPAITMTVNLHPLPLPSALQCLAAALVGLALALLPAGLAAGRPWDLVWLAADGLGLVPALLLLRALELPGRGLAVSEGTAYGVAFGAPAAGLAWLVATTALRLARGRQPERPPAVFAAGLALGYLVLPLAHYLGTGYLSAASNFFATNPVLQAVTLVLAAALATVPTLLHGPLRRHLRR